MNWGKFFLIFLRNMFITVALSSLFFGGVGFLLAGKAGFVNMAGWGLILGIVFAPLSLGGLVNAKFWGDYAGRFGSWWVRKETEGEENNGNRQ